MANVTIRLPQLPPYPQGEEVKGDDKLYIWNSGAGQLQHAEVAALPFGAGGNGTGNGAGAMLASPFMVAYGDPQFAQDGPDTVVSDARLLGKENYPVAATQLGGAILRPGTEITYNPPAGSFTIPGFTLMGGESLVVWPAGTPQNGTGGSMQALLGEMAELKAMLAPFLPSATGPAHGRVWWTGPPESIPPGWTEDAAMRNLYPLHRSTAGDAKAIGDMVGSNNHRLKLRSDQQGTIKFRIQRGDGRGKGNHPSVVAIDMGPGGDPDYASRDVWNSGANGDMQRTGWTGFRPGDGHAFIDIRPKSRVGMWIKYVGFPDEGN